MGVETEKEKICVDEVPVVCINWRFVNYKPPKVKKFKSESMVVKRRQLNLSCGKVENKYESSPFKTTSGFGVENQVPTFFRPF